MNDKIKAIMNGISYIDTELIEEALSDKAKGNKKAVKSKIIKLVISAAVLLFVFSVLIPFLSANVKALGEFTEKYIPFYYEYSKNFALNKKEIPADNEDRILYYSDLSAFHDKSTSEMFAEFTDELSISEAETVLIKNEALFSAAVSGPADFLSLLGFNEDAYSYELQNGFMMTDIEFCVIEDILGAFMTDGVYDGILSEYVFGIDGFTCILCTDGKAEKTEVVSTEQKENGFYTSVIAVGAEKYLVYYGISRDNDEYVLGYYYCSPYSEEITEENNAYEATQADIREMTAVAEKYLKIRAVFLSEAKSLLSFLGYTDFETGKSEGIYAVTTIDYEEFRSRMLQCMTEKVYNKVFSPAFMQDNEGKLCVSPGGGSGTAFEKVLSLSDNGDGTYTVFAKWEFGEGEYCTLRFTKADGIWLVNGT